MSKLPQFASEQEEAEFWAIHDATEFLYNSEPVDVTFVDARPKTHISLRLDPETLANLEIVARHQGVDYKTLVRTWLKERLSHELG